MTSMLAAVVFVNAHDADAEWREQEFALPSWRVLIGLGVFTFILANVISTFMARWRLKRIKQRTETISRAKGPRVPVTLLTGFLGAGKTTLLNHILKSETHGKRVAVIENEVGSISIDHSLLRRGDEGNPAEGVFVLNNGCVCCLTTGSSSELERVLETLCKLLAEDNFQYDYVVVESSGLADPSPIIQTFFRTALAKSKFYMDGVVTVVDAKNIGLHLKHANSRSHTKEAERQVAYADVIVVNKVDLVSPQQLDDVEELLLDVNPGATLLRAEHAKVDVSSLLDIEAFSESNIQKKLLEQASHHHHMAHDHTPEVTAVSVSVPGDVSLEPFKVWIRDLLKRHWRDLFRVKGIVSIAGSDRQFVAQGTHADFCAEFSDPWPSPDARSSQMVFIGRHLNEDDLQRSFDACRAGAAGTSVDASVADEDDSGAAAYRPTTPHA